MTKRALILTAALTATSLEHAAAQAWVYFKDKGNDWRRRLIEAGEFGFWNEDALRRRIDKRIPFDYPDAPVCESYLSSFGQKVKYASRWLNAAYVENPHPAPCVEKIVLADSYHASVCEDEWPGAYLGQAFDQLKLIHLDTLWGAGLRGNGVRIAVFDSGFEGYPNIRAFDHCRSKGQPVYQKDFVDLDDNPFDGDDHGTRVLSVVSAFIPDTLVGGATEADLILVKTEDVSREVKNEEYQWVAAAEWVETIGTDIIQSSVGYTRFEDHAGYSTSDLDGRTAAITLAANAANAAGILVVQSAGNEAGNEWNNIIFPCDGQGVMCVGSVRKTRERAASSSYGPTADGRIKPEVMALGAGAAVSTGAGAIIRTGGTSFAAPAVAALAAALMQSQPSASHREVFEVIVRSADRFYSPDTQYGYGIPDAAVAYRLLRSTEANRTPRITPEIVIYDNGKAFCFFDIHAFGRYRATFYDACGKVAAVMHDLSSAVRYETPDLPPGVTVVVVDNDRGIWRKIFAVNRLR
ncbi:MAG: S8 family serine peptidase [Bacteroidia bacterium]|nr:S8 family serine peptidase [Bacteroidia bacterium]